MPRLSRRGDAVCGIAGHITSINGVTPPPLVGSQGGGWDWLNDDVIIGQAALAASPTTWQVYSYDTVSGSLTLVAAVGANAVRAGGDIYQRWLSGDGVRTNTAGAPHLPNAGPGFVDRDGVFAVITNYYAGTGVTIYSAVGAILQSLTVSLMPFPIVVRDGYLAYSTVAGYQLVEASTGLPVPGYAQRQNIGAMIPVAIASSIVLVEYDAALDVWTIRPHNSISGLVVDTSGTYSFNVDAVAISPTTLRLAWATGAGELPSELVLLDVDMPSGQTQRAVVSGGTLVWSTGPTLAGQRFNPSLASSGYVPAKHPMIDMRTGMVTRPWLEYFQGTNIGLQTVRTQVNATPPAPSTAGGGGGGSPSTSTPLDAAVVLESPDLTFPNGRVPLDSATVAWDWSVLGRLRANASINVQAQGYWSPLTDGDIANTELIFAGGDAIMCWHPTP